MNEIHTIGQYIAAREALLARIAQGLESDARFAAAWLAGSYGRGEQDAVSDLDLWVVVEDAHSHEMCDRRNLAHAGAPAARLALFRRFGEPVNIHENHHNTPQGGSFSAVVYRDPPVMVDWVLVPRALANRPARTRLLFDRAGIPFSPPEPELDAQERAARLAERTAFFWMMAAVAAKYIVRGQVVDVQWALSFIAAVVGEIERLRGREPSAAQERLYINREEQSARLRALCDQVVVLSSPNDPRAQIETILNLKGPQSG